MVNCLVQTADDHVLLVLSRSWGSCRGSVVGWGSMLGAFRFFLEAQFQFELVAVHLPGVSNGLADDLSRDRLGWGRQWRGARVRCRCDNMAAVHCIASRSCRDPPLMHLLRCL